MANKKIGNKSQTTNMKKKSVNNKSEKSVKDKNIKRNTTSTTINKKVNIKEQSDMYDILEDDKKNSGNKIIIILSIIIFICIFLNVFIIYMYIKNPKIKIKIEEKYKVPENIVFLGDSITDYYDVKKYYSNNKVVNSGFGGNVTEDIKENMYDRVYRYNPSKVFLLIGTNDAALEVENDEIIDNIRIIVSKIKEERSQAKVYIESIYPINDDSASKGNRTNENIKELNAKIKELCNKEKIKYINLYDKLVDEEGNIKSEYTTDGLHITEEGYEFITKELEKYVLE